MIRFDPGLYEINNNRIFKYYYIVYSVLMGINGYSNKSIIILLSKNLLEYFHYYIINN